MTLPLLLPRGIFIPTHMIFNPQLPSAVLATWIQLRCLAWDGWVTPALSMQELAVITGKSQAKLYKHMSQLRNLEVLSWCTTASGSIIVSFIDQLSNSHHEGNPPMILNSHNQETPDRPSYFPPQILGYLSFQDEDIGFSNVDYESEDKRQVKRVARGNEEPER